MGPARSDLSDVFVVVPVFNERPTIDGVLRELVAICPNVVVVDDGSSDGTAAVARRRARWTLRHPVNRGQGAAIQTGLDFARRRGAGVIVTFDGDGQHDPQEIEHIVAPIRRGECDVVLGSRFLGSAPRLPAARRLAIRLAVVVTRVLTGLAVTDTHNGLRAFSDRAAARIDITLDRMAHASELLDIIAREKLAWCEVPVHIRYTDYSLGKGQTLANAPRVLLHYLIGRLVG
jgi:glycosyltransferase involved in cell wall biosynthesis